MLVSIFLAILALLACLTPPAHAEGEPTRRFALVIGANDGGTDRVRLRYASRDAEGFAEVISRLGGVAPDDLSLLADPAPETLDAALAALTARLEAAAGARRELLVFYSGHADEQGLLFGGARLPYTTLRARVQALPADVRITIVDACASGALIRAKGGRRAPPFLLDRASSVRGVAYLASASADEAAQESDRIQASFFSHALLTGLQGAADISGDQVVTLNEAYQFAFRETLARTEGSQLGAQHPSYDMQLMGSGDVVLTDLRRTSAGLALADELGGRFFVRDADERLVAELHKPAGQPISLGLPPGAYQVRLDATDGAHLAGQIDVPEGASVQVTAADLHAVARMPTVGRGGAGGAVAASGEAAPGEAGAGEAGAVSAEVTPPRVPFGVSVVPGLSTDQGEAVRTVSLNVLIGESRGVEAVEASGLGADISGRLNGVQGAGLYALADRVEGVQGAGVFTVTRGDATGVQGAGVFTLTGGQLTGVQGAGVVTVAEAVRGVQGAGVVSVSEAIEGVQGAGVVTVAGRVKGLQGTSVAAVAGDVLGAQVSGVVAVAGDVEGVQAGTVVAVASRVRGLQLGLVTVADHVDGAAIALVPWVRDGRHIVEITSTDLVPVSLGTRLGNAHVHSKLEAGWDPDGARDRLVLAAGLGGHVDFGRLGLEIDLMWHGLWGGGSTEWLRAAPQQVAALRAQLQVKLGAHVALVAGPSWNVAYNDDAVELPYMDAWRTREVEGKPLQMWPGFAAGVQLF